MFFKRKNLNPDFEHKANLEDDKTKALEGVEPSQETASVDKKLEAQQAKEQAIEEAKRALEQELAVKHYYHKQLLETLDLGLLSNLGQEQAKKDLHEAILQMMNDDPSQALSAEE